MLSKHNDDDGPEVEGEDAPETPEPPHSEIGFEKREDNQQGPKQSAFFVLKRTVREFGDDGATDLAAALTYYSVLAIFPGLIALLSLVGVLGQAQKSVDVILEILDPLVSTDVIKKIDDPLYALASSQVAGVTLVIGLLGALWSASGYVGAFSRAMNKTYEVEEGRPFWRLRPMQLIVTVATVTLCAVSLVILIVSGPVAESIGNTIGVGDDLVTIWGYAKWPVLALVVMVIVALLYFATPNVKFVKHGAGHRQRPGRGLELCEVAPSRDRGDDRRRVALLRDAERRLPPLPADLGRCLRGHPRVAGRLDRLLVLRRQLLLLRQDLRFARRCRRRVAVAVDHQPRPALRCRARRGA